MGLWKEASLEEKSFVVLYWIGAVVIILILNLFIPLARENTSVRAQQEVEREQFKKYCYSGNLGSGLDNIIDRTTCYAYYGARK